MLKQKLESFKEVFTGSVQSIQAAAMSAANGIGELRARLKDLEDERQALRSRPVPLAEAITGMRQWVGETAARLREEHTGLFVGKFGRPPILDSKFEEDTRRLVGPQEAFDFFTDIRWSATHLVALFPDELARNLEQILTLGYAQPAYVAGIPAGERQARYTEVVREIRELEEAEETIIRQARASGIRIDRRPNVQGNLLSRVRTLRTQVEEAREVVQRNEQQLQTTRQPEWRKDVSERLERARAALAPLQAELAELEPTL